MSAEGRHRHAISDLFELLGRRWMLRVLWELRSQPLAYGELRDACDAVSTSVLADRLRELVAAELVERDDRGRYVLTETGRTLLELLSPLNAFAKQWRDVRPIAPPG